MTVLSEAIAAYTGGSGIDAFYVGATKIWPTVSNPVIVTAKTTGTAANGQTATITLPAWTSGDYLLLATSRNSSDGTAWVGDGSASVIEIVNVTRRVSLLKVVPNPSATSFVLTAAATGLWSWCCLNLGQVTPAVHSAVDDLGTNATSSIAFLPINLSPATNGNELVVAVAGTNSTAIWTTPAGSTTQDTATAAPGLLVATYAPSAGLSSVAISPADRGNDTVNRYECAIAVVLRG